jgi:hypothetical protein
MNNFFDFLDKHKFGILASLLVYIGLFIYLQMETYQKLYVVPIWDERAELELPNEIEINPENIQQQINPEMGDVKSISQSSADQREKSYENWSPNKTAKQIEEDVKNLEKKFFEESGQAEKREQILQENKNQLKETKSNEKNKTPITGSDKAYAGNVMVDWILKDREPHQGNSWHVRNPGYTCGAGSSGKVSIKIKVDATGKVTTASFSPEQSFNVNSCMIEQAKKYALLSRFSYSNSAPKSQEGLITYTFISQ